MNTFAELSGRRILVTGASSGIGRAIAIEAARAGARVLVHFGKSQAAAEAVAAECRRVGPAAETIACDLTELDSYERFVDSAWSHWQGLDGWVNNAGADLLTGPLAKADYSDKLAALWQVDVRGTVLLSKAIGSRLRADGRGVILNIGWDQADRGMEGDSGELFAVAKSAIMAFTRSLALSLAPQVRVNCIAPGWIRTAWGVTASAVWQERVLRETPLRRWGTPEDIARVARFLLSDDADYLTGQVLNANGGAVR